MLTSSRHSNLAAACSSFSSSVRDLIALPLAIDMLVAYIAADRAALFSIISNPDKFTTAAPYAFLIASLLVLIFGPGKASLDTLFAGRAGFGHGSHALVQG
jgi:hypothetical protein